MSAITVVGAGLVGRNLATRFHQLGHVVTFAGRDPQSEKVTAASEALAARSVGLADATDGADLVVLAVPFDAVVETVSSLGELGSTILVDATNTVGRGLPDGATSVVDVIATSRPEAMIVKAFNTIGAEAYLDPSIDGQPLFLPVAGDAGAAERVAELADAMGFDALVIGDRSAVPMVERFAEMWIHLAFRAGLGRTFGFALLQR